VAQQLVQSLLVLDSATVGINKSPKQDEEDEETGNGDHTGHIHHLIELISNEDTESSEEEESQDPGPHQHGIDVQTRTFTGAARVKHAKENQDKDHNEQNSHEPHFSFN